MRSQATFRNGAWPLIAAYVLVLPLGRGFQAGLSFTGALERVGDGSISVKLFDRKVIDAMLPNTANLAAVAIARKYKMGDEVEIRCKPIAPVWEPATSRLQSLEVTQMRFVRSRSVEEVLGLMEARPREGKNLLEHPKVVLPKPDQAAGEGSKELENARRVNLDYASKMPNFVADEVAKRHRSTRQAPQWKAYDTVEAEIAFRGRRAVRQDIRRNGKPWNQPFDALPGFKWYEGFSTEISPMFDPTCPTTLEFQGRSRKAGRQVLEYSFRSPVDGCFPYLYFTYQRYNSARSGRVFIDAASGSVIQVDDQADEFLPGFEFAAREEHMFWDNVKIGDGVHLLPVRANFLVTYSDGVRYKVEVQYKNHRHFEASTNVTFQ